MIPACFLLEFLQEIFQIRMPLLCHLPSGICIHQSLQQQKFIRPVEKTPASAGGEMNRPNQYLIAEHAFDF